MNIFIMVLVSLFMAGYFWLSSPSQQIPRHETGYAVTISDLRSVAQCVVAVHNAQINGYEFQDVCVEQNGIISKFVCLNNKLQSVSCEATDSKKPVYNYIVTATASLDPSYYNSIMEILETYYTEAGALGMFQDNKILSGGTSTKRSVPESIITEMELADGQLVYLTQYDLPDAGTEYEFGGTPDIICPLGMAEVFRFGRWQCVAYNTNTDCGGDMIWDANLYSCVPDETRRPLCASGQTAIIVDDMWECIDPFPERTCPSGLVARLNYNSLEWECVTEPGSNKDTSKCDHMSPGVGVVTTGIGTTLLIPQTSCTDCERMVLDPETCKSSCVPDVNKIYNESCYPGVVRECSGPSRAFYFGFPSREYASNLEFLDGVSVPIGAAHSQNRRFNCMDCGDGVIDSKRSLPPFVAVCSNATAE